MPGPVTRCRECFRFILGGAGCPLHPAAPAIDLSAEPAEPATMPAITGWQSDGLLGSGGFASVYAVRSEQGRAAALKVAHRAGDPRFAREAAALRTVGPPTCPRLYAEGQTEDGRTYLVMEKLSGEVLSDHMAGLPAEWMSLDQAMDLVGKLCSTVDSVHRAGVCHRDLKPHNVFLCSDGRVALIDFGLARGTGDEMSAVAPELTRTGERMGTVLYMSPEQCHEAKEADRASDIYSLGVLIFELIAGRPPFVGDVAHIIAAHVSMRPPRLSDHVSVSPAFDDALARAMAKLPEDRFESAAELGQALQRAARAGPKASSTVAPASQPARSSTRQQICLCAVRSALAADRLVERFGSVAGQLCRTSDERYLFAFPDQPSAGAGVAAAVRCLQGLIETDPTLSAVVHVCELRVRRSGDRIRLSGRPLEHAVDWLPGSDPAGIHLTEAAAAESPEMAERGQGRTVDATVSRSYVTLSALTGHITTGGVPAGFEIPLVGRDDLLAETLADGRAALDNHRPGVTTILGDAGMGKSRVLMAVREQLGNGPRVIDIRVPPPSAGDPDAALRTLLEHGLSVRRGDPVERIEAACRDRLGEELAATSWPAVALVLDSMNESDSRVAPILAAPGALRQSTARAAGTALRKQAEQPLVILVDDAHHADQAALDAIEMATLSGEPLSIWVCVAATPALLELRPLWGERAGQARSLSLAGLADKPMRDLATRLLEPVEFVPEPVLARLVEQAAGVPLYMVELVQALRTGGAIRRHRGTEEWYVAADEIAKVTAAGPTQSLAAQSLARLPEHLVGLAELCAVLGDPISPGEVDSMARRLPGAAAAVDPSFGLPRLARLGLLRRTSKKDYRFRHSIVREALEARMPPGRRAELHRIVLEQLDQADVSRAQRERIARHARGAGQHALAAAAHFELAKDDARRHRYVDADNHYSAALDLLGTDDRDDRERALAGRGTIRYRLQRFPEALADLEAARALAEARGDTERVASLLLDEATVLDWIDRWDESAERVSDAETRLAGSAVAESHAAALAMAKGRTAFRQQRLEDSEELLTLAARQAPESESEIRVISLLLLGATLAARERLVDCEKVFDEVLAICQRAGDSFHRCVAYNNRLFLWIKQQNLEQAQEDQLRALALARDLGFGPLERSASYNLAELLYQLGKPAAAVELGVRSFELAKRLSLHPAFDAILLARIACAQGDFVQARERLAFVEGEVAALTPLDRAFVKAIELQIAEDDEVAVTQQDWKAVLDEFEQVSVLDERIEALQLAASWAYRHERAEVAELWLSTALELSDSSPIWRQRLLELKDLHSGG